MTRLHSTMRYTDSNSNATTVREQMNSVYVTRASTVPSEEINCFHNLSEVSLRVKFVKLFFKNVNQSSNVHPDKVMY